MEHATPILSLCHDVFTDLTALECYEYASKTKQLQDTFISLSRCYKCFFDDDDATIGIFSTLSSSWIVHNFLKLSGRFLQCIPSVDGCQRQVQPQSRTSKKNCRTLNFEHLILFSVFATVIPIVLPV